MKIYHLTCYLFLNSSLLLSLNCFAQVVKVTYTASAVKVINDNKNTQNVLSEIARQSSESLKTIDFFSVSNNIWNHTYYEKPMANDAQIGDWSDVAISIALDGKQLFIDYANQKAYYESDLIKKVKSVDISNVEWSITSKSKEILGYVCYKATAKIIDPEEDGKLVPPIEAWFAPKLSIRGGPTAYATLPGMILEVKSSKILFKAKRIQFVKERVLKTPNYDSEDILSHKEWEAYFENNTTRLRPTKQ